MGRGDLEQAAAVALAIGDAAATHSGHAAAADAWTASMRYGSAVAAQHLLDQDGSPVDAVRDLVRAHAAAVVAHDAPSLVDVADAYWRLYAVEAAATAAQWHLGTDDTVEATAATERLLRWRSPPPASSTRSPSPCRWPA